MTRNGRLVVKIPGYSKPVAFADWTHEKMALRTLRSIAGEAVWLLAQGAATSGDISVRDFMYDVMLSLARGGAGIADDVCASAALYLAEVEVPKPKRWRKDGLATGIKPKPVPRFALAYVSADELDEPKPGAHTAVGVLKEG